LFHCVRDDQRSCATVAPDLDAGDGLVFLTRLQWDIDRIERDNAGVKLTATKAMMV